MIDSQHPLVRVTRIARPQMGRLALGIVLGALAIGAGIGLMATAGYLISRAALRPPILELGVAIVAVRFFGVSRGVLRYLERLVSHDAALRALATLRVRLFVRLEPLVPSGLPAVRTGDLLGRFVADVDALRGLYLRGLGPAVVALLASALAVAVGFVVLPVAGVVLALFLLLAGVVLPLAGVALTHAALEHEAPARAELTSELLDALAAAPELVAYGASDAAAARVEAADGSLTRARRRTALVEAFSEGAMTALAMLAVVAVLVVATPAVHSGSLAGVKLALLALLTLAAFEAVRPLPVAAGALVAASAVSRRVLDLTDRDPPVRDPAVPRPLRGVPGTSSFAASGCDMDRPGRSCSTASTSTFPSARSSPWSVQAARARRHWRTCSCGSAIRMPARSCSTAMISATTPRPMCGGSSDLPVRRRTSSRRPSARIS